MFIATARNKKLTVHGDGVSKRSYLHVKAIRRILHERSPSHRIALGVEKSAWSERSEGSFVNRNS